MKWLARIKIQHAPEMDATKPTKPIQGGGKGGFVGFVAPALALIEKITVTPDAMVSSPIAGDPGLDRWCWPHSPAMNGEEIGTFMVRERGFVAKGLAHTDSQMLADRLVRRDRESDDRRVCLECDHLARGWRCNNWQVAGGGMGANRARLANDLVLQLQRCDGFKAPG